MFIYLYIEDYTMISQKKSTAWSPVKTTGDEGRNDGFLWRKWWFHQQTWPREREREYIELMIM